MTPPDLLRLVRSCAKWMGGILLVATLYACTPAGAEPRLTVSGPMGVVPGDSLPYTLRWTAATRATGYLVRVSATATNGTWTGLPNGTAVSGLVASFIAVNAAWDSVTFTATVESVDQVGPTGKTSSVTWKAKRRAGPPGPITVDSSLIISGLRILPESITIARNETLDLCALIQFATGPYALRQVDSIPVCVQRYQQTIPLAQRQITVAQQARADSVCVEWSATGGTIAQEACMVNPSLLDQRGLLFQVALR